MYKLKTLSQNIDGPYYEASAVEYLSRLNVEERVQALGFILGLKVNIPKNVFSSKDIPEIEEIFRVEQELNIRNLLNYLKENKVFLPVETVINLARNVYIAACLLRPSYIPIEILRYQITDSDNSTEFQIDLISKTIFDVACKLTESDIHEMNVNGNSSPALYGYLDQIINEHFVENPSIDLGIDIWRRKVLGFFKVYFFIKAAAFFPTVDLIKSAIITLNKTGGVLLDRESKVLLGNVEKLAEVFIDLVLEDDTLINALSTENVNVMGKEEMVFYSDGVETVLEHEKLDNLASTMVSSIIVLRNELGEKDYRAHEEYLGYEDLRETVGNILAILGKHLGIVLPALVALVSGMVYYLLKSKSDSKSGSKEKDKHDSLAKKVEDINVNKYTPESLGVSTQKSEAALFAFRTKYCSKLDQLIIEDHPGYGPDAILLTINAHIRLVDHLREELIKMSNLFSSGIRSSPQPHQLTEMLKNLKDIFEAEELNKLQFTLRPVFTYVTAHGGHLPCTDDEPDLFEEANREISYRPKPGDKFWDGDYHTKDGKVAQNLHPVKPYSFHKKVVTMDNKAIEKIERVIKFDDKNAEKLLTECEGVKNSAKNTSETMVRDAQTVNLASATNEENVYVWPEGPAIGKTYHDSTIPPDVKSTALAVNDVVSTLLRGANIFSNRSIGMTHVMHSVNDLKEVVKRYGSIKAAYDVYWSAKVKEQEEFLSAIKKKNKEEGNKK